MSRSTRWTCIIANLTVVGDPNTTYILSNQATVNVETDSAVSATLSINETLYFITTEYPSVGMWSQILDMDGNNIIGVNDLTVNQSSNLVFTANAK